MTSRRATFRVHPTRRSARIHRRAFTFLDMLVGTACTSSLVALGAVGLSGSRAAARRDFCAEKLGQLGASSAQFALANQGLFAGFTWEQGGANSQYPDLNTLQAAGATGAHAAQAADFLRRRGLTTFPAINGWIPDIYYWTLPLVEFEGRPLSDAFNLCPSDDRRNKWRRWPEAFMQGQFLPHQPFPSDTNDRWIYSSSYTPSGAAFDRNQTVFTPAAVAARVEYAGWNSIYTSTAPGARLGPSASASIAFPSNKVQAFDDFQRHLARPNLYYAYPNATQPILFFDGAVSVRVSRDANAGWTPTQPQLPTPQVFQFHPAIWQDPTLTGFPEDKVLDRYRWTREGLLGWDFQN